MSVSIEKLIESFVNPEVRDDEQQKAFDSIKEIFSNQQLTIQDLIKLLESALISDQEKKRYRGTLLLSDLLLQVSSFPLNSAVIHLLVVFFNQRLSDYPSIIPALRALLAIVKFHSANFDAKYLDFVDIVQTIFKVFDVQSYAQSIRQCIYELLLDAFMQSQCREQCMTIATDVFAGVMVSFDGEKDPRCLLVALDLLLSAVHSFHTTMTADVFEKVSDTLAAYFPISFQPPPDDPYGITAEDLNKKLFDCFLCHPSLLPYCLPYFATQLLSDTSTTKVFAMEAIGQLCRTYGVSILTSTFGNISESQQPAIYRVTEAILDVLFESGSADAVTRGLDFVYEIASLIGTSPHAKYADEWKLFCAPLLQKSVRIIAESADSLKGEAACMIACCISASSVLCSGIVFQECLPPLLTVLEKAHHSPIASATSDMVSSSCDNPDHHHDHSHNHDYNNDRTGQLLAKTQMKHLRLLNQLLASCGFNSLLTIQQADKDICELYQGFNVVFVRTAKLLKSTDRHTCLLPAVVANSFGALGPLNPLGPFAAELLSMLKQLLESSSCIEITESKAIRDHCYESLSILIVRLGELSIDEALLSQLRVCIILATKDALGNQDRRIETAKQPSAVKFLVTVVLTPSLTELMSDCCFGKVSSLPQSHHTLALVATLGRQLNLFGQGDGSRKLFSTCFDRLAFHFINFADIGMFMSDVEAISAILISEGEFEAWSEPTQRSIRVYPQTNADFSFSLCTPGGLVQVAIEHLFALGRNDEESNSDSYALLKRVCSLIHRVFLALVDDAPKQSDTGVRLLEVIQLQYDTCLGGRKTFFATSLVLSVLIYLNRSAEFFAKSHHSSITSNMDLELVSGSFTSVFTAIPFFIVTWMSSIDCAPVATEVLSVLLNKIPVGQFKIAGPHILRVVYAALERTRTEEMADESASSQIDIAADLLLRVCKAVLLRPLIRVDGDWKATLSQSEFSQLGSEFLQGLVSITSWQSFSVALLITLVTAPEQLVGHSISKSQQLSRAISTRLGLLLVSDDVLNFKLSDLNLNLMHRQRTWSCLFAPLFAESQRQLTLSSGVKVRSLLTAICSLATSLSADILADSLSDLVVIVVQALMLSCDALFEQQPSVPLANPADGSILLVSAEIVNGSSTIVSASSMLPSSSTSQEEKRTTLDEQDLLLCNQSLSSLESLLSQNTELFSSHSSGIINRLLTVCQLHPEAQSRFLSLKCLHHLTRLPYHQLHSTKAKVLKTLGHALNDSKRAIRALAARIRNEYFALT